jgi:aldehyde dehydrogenase (NAD+)
MEMFDSAGMPPGVVNMVVGKGSELGDVISGHPLVRGITFTGSTAVGKRINKLAAENFTKCQLEMGGKNPAVIANFKNLAFAATQLSAGGFALAGQRCTVLSRVIVLTDQAEELENLIAEHMKTFVVGDGMDPKVSIGPVMNKNAGENILAYIQSARDEGATIKVGGKQLASGIYDKGFWIEPTLITNVKPSMKIAVEEIFGPVLVVLRVDNFEEALQVANDTKYGLAASIFTDDLDKIYTFQQEIETGMVHINHGTVTDGTMPFGGVKQSGVGQFSKGKTNKDFFTQLKVVYTKYI